MAFPYNLALRSLQNFCELIFQFHLTQLLVVWPRDPFLSRL